MNTSIAYFHTSFYITEIQNNKFNLNTMAAINLFLLNSFKRNTLLQQQNHKHQQHHNQEHDMLFYSFFSDYRKEDDATTDAHRKRIIELLKKRKILSAKLYTLWENIYGFNGTIYVPRHYTCCHYYHNNFLLLFNGVSVNQNMSES